MSFLQRRDGKGKALWVILTAVTALAVLTGVTILRVASVLQQAQPPHAVIALGIPVASLPETGTDAGPTPGPTQSIPSAPTCKPALGRQLTVVLPWDAASTAKYTRIENQRGNAGKVAITRCESTTGPCRHHCQFFFRRADVRPDIADAVMFDSIGKVKEDLKFFNVSAKSAATPRPLRVLWNTENWAGRMGEWGSKYRTRWLNRSDSVQRFWRQFDLIASFERTADVCIPYAHQFGDAWRAARRAARMELASERSVAPSLMKEKRADSLALFVASNCFTKYPDAIAARYSHPSVATLPPGSGKFPRHREGLVKVLAAHGLLVRTHGLCMESSALGPMKDIPGCGDWGPATKLCAMRKHLFYLAFENSVYPDYVTEKLYHPLAAGAIPVYIGAPNVEEFLPTSHAIIKVTDFSNASALVRYLQCVARNASVAAHYLSWPERPPFPRWASLVAANPLCSICSALAAAAATSSVRDGADGRSRHGRPPSMPTAEVLSPYAASQRPLPCGLDGVEYGPP